MSVTTTSIDEHIRAVETPTISLPTHSGVTPMKEHDPWEQFLQKLAPHQATPAGAAEEEAIEQLNALEQQHVHQQQAQIVQTPTGVIPSTSTNAYEIQVGLPSFQTAFPASGSATSQVVYGTISEAINANGLDVSQSELPTIQIGSCTPCTSYTVDQVHAQLTAQQLQQDSENIPRATSETPSAKKVRTEKDRERARIAQRNARAMLAKDKENWERRRAIERERVKARRAMMTDEERQQAREKARLQQSARRARFALEERERERARNRERARKARQALSPEEKAAKNERARVRLRELRAQRKMNVVSVEDELRDHAAVLAATGLSWMEPPQPVTITVTPQTKEQLEELVDQN